MTIAITSDRYNVIFGVCVMAQLIKRPNDCTYMYVFQALSQLFMKYSVVMASTFLS